MYDHEKSIASGGLKETVHNLLQAVRYLLGAVCDKPLNFRYFHPLDGLNTNREVALQAPRYSWNEATTPFSKVNIPT